MLIPIGNADDTNRTALKTNGQSLSFDAVENDAFSLLVSHENEQRQINNITTLHSQISDKTYKMEELKHALGEILQENSFKDSTHAALSAAHEPLRKTSNGSYVYPNSSSNVSGL